MASTEQQALQSAVGAIAEFVADLRWETLPQSVRERLPVMLTDLLGVTIAGYGTRELQALTKAWAPAVGAAPLFGTSLRTDPETAAELNAVAACCLELDEGNKYAQGHPAVHVVFAVLAAVNRTPQPVSGASALTAIVAGYEVAARFGAALSRSPAWHTHGHWGATGAAAAASLLRGEDSSQIAAAIDTAGALMLVTPWQHVLRGNFTRNLWAGHANRAGLNAAHLAASGLVSNTGSLAYSLGSIIGRLEPDRLTVELGERWLLTEGYFKLHSSCSYTHAAVDVVLRLMSEQQVDVHDLDRIRVRIHSLAQPLIGRQVTDRITAMFSLPFVVAAAAVNSTVSPETMDPKAPAFSQALKVMEKVDVLIDPELDRYLPAERRVALTLHLSDGTVLSGAQHNPIGDCDYLPLDATGVRHKISSLIGSASADAVAEFLSELPTCSDVGAAISTFHSSLTSVNSAE